MPFPFSYVYDLLQRLDDNRRARSGVKTNASIIEEWFRTHRSLLSQPSFKAATLLSALLPEKRTDRVYLIREKKLQILIGRGLGIAAACRFSSPAVRSSFSTNPSSSSTPADSELSIGALYRRLSARDVKWFTRMVLKNYEPVILSPHVVYRCLHPFLPLILKVQDDLSVAGSILDRQRAQEGVTHDANLSDYLKPSLGVKIGRQTWIKGRSIKHCLSMLQGRISCEEKADGEYCQIHIDLSKGRNCIQIFSKTGKDGTADRFALHDAIRRSLKLGEPDCPLQTGCILEGELVVYSDKQDERILDFHKIRKHVSRSGSFLGTEEDSLYIPHRWEHLMIVYYDILMLDDESLLGVIHSKRFQHLKSLITVVLGYSALVKRVLIDCNSRSAISNLRRVFAKYITSRREGLVLKSDDSYFNFSGARRPYACCAIKLKKEYIGGFGDIGDFAVVGARYDAAKAKSYNLKRVKWTHFYVGCLENEEEAHRFGKRPRYRRGAKARSDLPLASRRLPPLFFFFDKEGNTDFWSPRFPMVNKIHFDRTHLDVLLFTELQQMASNERNNPPSDDSQDLLNWIARLEEDTNSQYAATDDTSQSTIISTAETMTDSQKSSNMGHTGAGGSNDRKKHIVVPIKETTAATAMTNYQQSSGTGCAGGIPSSAPSWQMERIEPPQALTKTCMRDPKEVNIVVPLLSPKAPMLPVTQDFAVHPGSVHGAGSKRPLDDASQHSPGKKLQRQSSNSSSLVPYSDRNKERSMTEFREPSVDLNIAVSQVGGNLPTVIPTLFSSTSTSTSQLLENDENQSRATEDFRLPSLPTPIPSIETDSSAIASIPTPISTSTTTSTVGQCVHRPRGCRLSDYSVLLAPCIADSPWITEDLLPGHGVTNVIRDPVEWKVTDSRPKKRLILVETKRTDASLAFLNRIAECELLQANGKVDLAEIFDWRALEELRDEEVRRQPARRTFTGLNNSFFRGLV
ncbi:hypothetical protein QBC35DRAFT_296263 [Podospora australis]|uniref:ATP-dependent DNA ligase family profile domain-containing protein n=1 Tax=Podospora australis TaxID=1536484 RepID=A0AAN6X0R8_9PEZI|nr:hypothetical protein QBC35DRAFT_296263 [Podospora australis]